MCGSMVSWSMQPFGHNRRRPKIGWGSVPLSPSNTVTWAEAYLHTKWHLDASSRLDTTKMGRKLGRLCPLFGEGSCIPVQHNVDWTKAYLHAKCHLDPSNRLATVQERHRQTGNGLIVYSPKNFQIFMTLQYTHRKTHVIKSEYLVNARSTTVI